MPGTWYMHDPWQEVALLAILAFLQAGHLRQAHNFHQTEHFPRGGQSFLFPLHAQGPEGSSGQRKGWCMETKQDSQPHTTQAVRTPPEGTPPRERGAPTPAADGGAGRSQSPLSELATSGAWSCGSSHKPELTNSSRERHLVTSPGPPHPTTPSRPAHLPQSLPRPRRPKLSLLG